MNLYLNDLGLLCAAGNSKAEVLKRLLAGDRSGLVPSDEFGTRCFVGAVTADLPEIPPGPPFSKGGDSCLVKKESFSCAEKKIADSHPPFSKGGDSCLVKKESFSCVEKKIADSHPPFSKGGDSCLVKKESFSCTEKKIAHSHPPFSKGGDSCLVKKESFPCAEKKIADPPPPFSKGGDSCLVKKESFSCTEKKIADSHPPFSKGGDSCLVKKESFSYAGKKIAHSLPPLKKGGKGGIYDCRNNRLLLAALSQIEQTVSDMKARFGVDRIGIVLGTSTSGVRNTELALAYWADHGALPDAFHYKQQQMGAGADFLADFLGIQGPAYTISTACSSSGKAFASARRLIRQGICDAVIVGGADSLCGLTVNGFEALESISTGLCKPFGLHRDGINIGEAVSLFVLSKKPGPVVLQGIGATSDAHHFAAPDPDATDVIRAMQNALDDAGKTPAEIDYLNLHGTATVLNDAMESKAVNALFGQTVAASSSKGMTGHTLGAAAALELAFCWLLLTHDDEQGALIPNINDDEPDTTLPALNLVKKGGMLGRRINTCQSNSFAFGGNNLSIVVERA